MEWQIFWTGLFQFIIGTVAILSCGGMFLLGILMLISAIKRMPHRQ